jgi:hypothetical protein
MPIARHGQALPMVCGVAELFFQTPHLVPVDVLQKGPAGDDAITLVVQHGVQPREAWLLVALNAAGNKRESAH